MNIEIKTVNTVTLTFDEAEARAILVDPSAFQESLRHALADAPAASDTRKNQLAIGGGNGRTPKAARRPLARASGSRDPRAGKRYHMHKCPECGKARHHKDSTCSHSPFRTGARAAAGESRE